MGTRSPRDLTLIKPSALILLKNHQRDTSLHHAWRRRMTFSGRTLPERVPDAVARFTWLKR
jgi:hypothetical protein